MNIKKKSILKTLIVGILLITLIGNLPSKKLIEEYTGKTNTTNLMSGYRLFDAPDNTPEDDKPTNDVENSDTGSEGIILVSILGILGASLILFKAGSKNKVYKI